MLKQNQLSSIAPQLLGTLNLCMEAAGFLFPFSTRIRTWCLQPELALHLRDHRLTFK